MVNPAGSALKHAVGGFTIAIASLMMLTGPAASSADAIVGTWLTEEGTSKVEIGAGEATDGGTVYSGKVSWLKDATSDGKPLLDARNNDAALRSRPILGLEILSGFRATAAGAWAGGTLYSPRNGESFPAELSLTTDGRLQVKIKAGLVTRTVYWTR